MSSLLTSEQSPSSTMSGRAPGLIQRLVKRVLRKDSLLEAEVPTTSDTSVMVTEVTETSPKNQLSITSANSTFSPSIENTVWTSPPIGFAQSARYISPAEVALLPEPLHSKFISLAHGRNQEPGAFVYDIIEDMTDDFEDEIPGETVLDVVEEFFKNRVL